MRATELQTVMHSSPPDAWAAHKAEHRFRWISHFLGPYLWPDLRQEEQIRGVLRGHHKILRCINHNRCTAKTFRIQLAVLRKSIAGIFGLPTAILQSCNQRSREWRLCPQVAVTQCRLAERGYVGRVFRLEHQPEVAGDCWHGVHAQAEEKLKVHPQLACHKKSMWMSGRVFWSMR